MNRLRLRNFKIFHLIFFPLPLFETRNDIILDYIRAVVWRIACKIVERISKIEKFIKISTSCDQFIDNIKISSIF